MIDGVIIKNLITHSDERGFFREIFRFTEDFPNVTVGQLSHSLVNEGVIKAWHGHLIQSQWNYVVSGRIKVVLYDDRKNSKTFKESMEFLVGENESAKAYFFPCGVLHGYMCLNGPMNIVYVTSSTYDITDEIRKSDSDIDFSYKW